MHFIFATNAFLDPIVNGITAILDAINSVVHSRGWSLVIFALGFKLISWPLNTKQFMSMIKMQKLAPQMKALQNKYAKSDPQRYQKETMELYKREGANPLAGCWPMLVQYPIIISVYYAVWSHKALYANEHWLWVGAPFTQHVAPLLWKAYLFAPNLAAADIVLLLLYAISMYFYSRYATMPSADPQQAQTQKLMAIFSPLMLGFLGLRYNWPSAMVLYWFSYNLFTMGQQFYLLGKYHQPLSALDDFHAITDLPADVQTKALPKANGEVAGQQRGGSRRNKKKKRGARR
ncbi:MAG TPA: YidC/Oxa1 family membrane protein insertase [Candidatus Rubrimentiphilum sp.]|nr:YidC/Oxa1 family membrane protein insertase [Candidatus Rubrimentiphilum sp.]